MFDIRAAEAVERLFPWNDMDWDFWDAVEKLHKTYDGVVPFEDCVVVFEDYHSVHGDDCFETGVRGVGEIICDRDDDVVHLFLPGRGTHAYPLDKYLAEDAFVDLYSRIGDES